MSWSDYDHQREKSGEIAADEIERARRYKDTVRSMMYVLSDEERLSIIREFCAHCGAIEGLKCVCSRDE